MRTHHAGHRTFIGKRQGLIAQLRSTSEQLLRVRSAREKAEIAAAVKFGIGRPHTVYLYSIEALRGGADRRQNPGHGLLRAIRLFNLQNRAST